MADLFTQLVAHTYTHTHTYVDKIQNSKTYVVLIKWANLIGRNCCAMRCLMAWRIRNIRNALAVLKWVWKCKKWNSTLLGRRLTALEFMSSGMKKITNFTERKFHDNSHISCYMLIGIENIGESLSNFGNFPL